MADQLYRLLHPSADDVEVGASPSAANVKRDYASAISKSGGPYNEPIQSGPSQSFHSSGSASVQVRGSCRWDWHSYPSLYIVSNTKANQLSTQPDSTPYDKRTILIGYIATNDQPGDHLVNQTPKPGRRLLYSPSSAERGSTCNNCGNPYTPAQILTKQSAIRCEEHYCVCTGVFIRSAGQSLYSAPECTVHIEQQI